MLCSKCGTNNSDESRFCFKCGNDLSNAENNGKKHNSSSVFAKSTDDNLLLLYEEKDSLSKERQEDLLKELEKRNIDTTDLIKDVEDTVDNIEENDEEKNEININAITVEKDYNEKRYCKACGQPIEKEQAVCLNCGVPAGKGRNYCYYCGSSLMEDAVICVKCGCSTVGNANSFITEDEKSQYYRKLSDYEKTSGIIWLVIGIIQVLTVVGIICGIWNIVMAVQRLNYSKELMKKPPNVVKTFESQMTGLIIILVLNIFLGALIGVIGAAFDFYVRDYVLSNKEKYN